MNRKRLIQAFFYNNPDNYPPIINGTRLLASSGWDVELYCRDDDREWGVDYPARVKIERIKLESGSSWGNYLSFCTEALRRGSKHASAFVAHEIYALAPGRLLASLYRRPLVYHCYDYSGNSYPASLASRVLKTIQFTFARTANLVTIPDAELARLAIGELRLERPPVIMVNSPINKLSQGGALREALKNRGHQFRRVVLRQGRVGPGHAIETTIRSISHWADRTWGFVVMGIGEPDYLQSLTELAATVGVSDQFVALPPVSYDQLGYFTCDADIGHALYEPIHINNLNIRGACKIQEYMAAGLPLLVSDRPLLRSFVEKYGCGVTAEDASPASIATAVNSLLGDMVRAKELGKAGSRAFETKFRFACQFEPVMKGLEQLVSQRPTTYLFRHFK